MLAQAARKTAAKAEDDMRNKTAIPTNPDDNHRDHTAHLMKVNQKLSKNEINCSNYEKFMIAVASHIYE